MNTQRRIPMAVDPELLEILACPNCKTKVELVKDGTALKCAAVPARLSDQGRHPGDADRRSDDRAMGHDRAELERISGFVTGMKILLIRLRLIGDVVFTTPLLRALKRAYPGGAASRISSSRTAAPVVRRQSAPRRSDRGAAHARLAARSPTTCALARRLRRGRVRPGDRSARRSAQRVAGAGDRGAGAHRLRHPGPDLDVHAGRAPGRGRCAARHSVVNQWDLLEAIDGLAGRRPPDRRATRWRWRSTRRPTARIARRLRGAGIGPATRAGRGCT